MSTTAEALPPVGKKARRARPRQRPTDDLPVRIGGMPYARTASTPTRAIRFSDEMRL